VDYDPLDDVIIEGAHPNHDAGYFIIAEEPKKHLLSIERGIPVHLFCKRMKRRKTQMEFRVTPFPIPFLKLSSFYVG